MQRGKNWRGEEECERAENAKKTVLLKNLAFYRLFLACRIKRNAIVFELPSKTQYSSGDKTKRLEVLIRQHIQHIHAKSPLENCGQACILVYSILGLSRYNGCHVRYEY